MIAAIVLAAGRSERMGKPKQLLRLGEDTMLGRTIRVFRASEVDRTVIVLGADATMVRKSLKLRDERVVVNRAYRAGMSGSLKAGIRAVRDDADAVIIALGDQPFVSARTINAMIAAYRRKKGAIVIPVYRGKRGNPVLFGRSIFAQLEAIAGDVGAKSVVGRNEANVAEVEVGDEGVMLDIDTPEDYAASVSRNGPTKGRRSRGRA